MASRPRDRRRKDWPEGLREPRPGYFTWRKPDGHEMAIGRVTLALAKQEAIAANEFVRAQKPSLVERLSGAANTGHDLLKEMPVSPVYNTAKTLRSLDKMIAAALGDKPCGSWTVKDCADLIEGEYKADRKRQAQALRSRLKAVCAKGMTLGWMDFNPAEPTRNETVTTKRSRLTLEQFNAILAKASEVNEWLAGAMVLALVSGQDRDTLSQLERTGIGAEYLTAVRGKTGVTIEIPLRLRLDAIGMTLADALAGCRSNVVSKYRYVIHHARKHGNAPLGSRIHPDTFSHSFASARDLAGITWAADKLPPTWHELRSLCKRLYKAQGNVDTKALLGHLTERMSDLYEDSRGAEPIRVQIG